MSTEIQPRPFLGNENEGNDHLNSNHFQQPPVVSPVDHDSNVPYNISVDRILLCSTSPMNVLQHVTYNSENSMKNVLVLVRIDNALLFDRGHVLSSTRMTVKNFIFYIWFCIYS
ncbi:unnamed protein product [Prunus armeniaca]